MRGVVAALGAVLLLAGCTGVPSSSAPQTVEPLRTAGATAGPTASPSPNADPRTIVQSFLAANATNADGDTLARAYLTSAARNRWSDNTATIVADDYSVGTYDAKTHSVTVYGQVLGTLNAAGIYTPSLLNIGEGGPRRQFRYTLSEDAGPEPHRPVAQRPAAQRTRSSARPSSSRCCTSTMRPRPTWSPTCGGTRSATRPIGHLAADPTGRRCPAGAAERGQHRHAADPGRRAQPDRPSGVTDEDRDPRQQPVGPGGARPPRRPGGLHPLGSALRAHDEVTDGGKPVQIPSVGGTQFSAADFPSAKGPSPPDPAVYYLVNGAGPHRERQAARRSAQRRPVLPQRTSPSPARTRPARSSLPASRASATRPDCSSVRRPACIRRPSRGTCRARRSPRVWPRCGSASGRTSTG